MSGLTARALPILMYHHVCPQPGLITVSPENFSDQMAWLAAEGYYTASCVDLEGFLCGKPLPRKSVMITFDDGYLDNYVHAYPVLRQRGLHAIVFAVTDWIGAEVAGRPVAGDATTPPTFNHRQCIEHIQNGRADAAMMRWSEIRRTQADGVFEVHSHTASHTRWDKISHNAAEKTAALTDDLQRSRAALRQHLGFDDTHLCWPQGYFDADYQAVARAQGFTHLYTTHPGTTLPGSPADALPRIVVKDKGAGWLASRVHLYRAPSLARCYGFLKGN